MMKVWLSVVVVPGRSLPQEDRVPGRNSVPVPFRIRTGFSSPRTISNISDRFYRISYLFCRISDRCYLISDRFYRISDPFYRISDPFYRISDRFYRISDRFNFGSILSYFIESSIQREEIGPSINYHTILGCNNLMVMPAPTYEGRQTMISDHQIIILINI